MFDYLKSEPKKNRWEIAWRHFGAVLAGHDVGFLPKLILPYPVSVNRAWRRKGKRIVCSAEKRVYDLVVMSEGLKQGWKKYGRIDKGADLAVLALTYSRDQRVQDSDNVLKVPIDALEKNQVIPNDRNIVLACSFRGGVDPVSPRMEMYVWML